MPLTDVAVKKAAPKEKIYMLSDSRGLYLEVMPSGKKYWRLRYLAGGKEKKITIGDIPTFLSMRRVCALKRRGIALR